MLKRGLFSHRSGFVGKVYMCRDGTMMQRWWNCGSCSILWGRADAVVITARSDRGEFGHATFVFAKVAHSWTRSRCKSMELLGWSCKNYIYIYICIILGWRCSLFFVPKSTAGGGSHPEGTGSHGAEEVWAVAFRDPGAWCRPRMTNLLGTTWNNLEQLGTTWNNLEQLCINYVSVWFSLLLDGVTHAGLWAMRSGQTCWDEEADCDRQRCSARIYIYIYI